jgi:hypothetical protein
MKRLLIALALLIGASVDAAVETTTITGKVLIPNGSGNPYTAGTVTVTLSTAGTAVDGGSTVIVSGRTTATIAADGTVSFAVVPNDVISPEGTYYIVKFSPTAPTSASWTENWIVVTTPDPITIGAVTRVNTPPGIAAPVSTIQDEGADLAKRTKLNFVGAGVTCLDSAGQSRTDCTITSGGGGGTPGGVNQDVQVNVSSSFGPAPGFTANTTTGQVATRSLAIPNSFTTSGAGLYFTGPAGAVPWMTNVSSAHASYAGTGDASAVEALNIFLGINAGPATMPSATQVHEGKENIGIGPHALDALTLGNANTAIGRQSMTGLTTGQYNVGIGGGTLQAATTAFSNTALGQSAGVDTTSGNNNVFIGDTTGSPIQTGDKNTMVGSASYSNAADSQNRITLGYGVLADTDKKATIGNTDTEAGGAGLGTTLVELRGAVAVRDQADGFKATVSPAPLTADRAHSLPNAAGTYAITQSATGVPDTLVCTNCVDAVDVAADVATQAEIDAKLNDTGDTGTGTYDFSGSVFELPNGTAPTGTDCDAAGEAGRVFIDTDATSGQRVYVCEGVSGWILQGGAGGGSLATLSDVTLTTPATGATLIKSAGNWVDGQLDLADTDAVTGLLAAANVGTGLTDAQVSDTLTSSLFVGSGSTTTAIDLATAEVAGSLADASVSDTLTCSLFVGSGSTTTAVDLATAEVGGDLPFTSVAQIATDRLLGRDTAATGDIEQLTVGGGIEFTGTGIQTSAFTGDVTKTAGGTATTIAADSVALTTDTTGSYAAGDAEAGAALTGDTATAFFTLGALEVARGGTGAAPGADDQAIVSDSTSAATWRAIPNCVANNMLTYTAATNTFGCDADDGAGGGAPIGVDYLVGTADATLTSEIVVGTTPGGELGNTWASPTIDDSITVAGWTLTTATITDPILDILDSAAPAPTVEGRVEWESDDDHLIVGDGTAQVEFVPAEDVSGDATMTDAGVLTIAASAVTLTTDVTGILPVANGGTALSSGTSGGILGYTATGTLASSAALGAGNIVVGGGAGAVPTSVTAGATTTILVGGGASTAPVWTTATGTGAPARGTSPTITTPVLDFTQSAAPAPTVEGRVEWETDDDHLIIGDGAAQVEFVPAEDVSSDATMDDAGALTIAANAVALTTDTTGNYVSSATASQGLLLTGAEGASLGLATCTDGQILKNSGGTSWACAADSTGGAGAWTDADPIATATSTRDVQIGPTFNNTAKLSVDGDADQIQLSVQGNSTQTTSLMVLENSAGTDQLKVSNTGNVTYGSGADADLTLLTVDQGTGTDPTVLWQDSLGRFKFTTSNVAFDDPATTATRGLEWSVTSPVSTKLYAGVCSADFNSNRDNIFAWSYNRDCNGTRIDTAEHSTQVQLETSFDSSATAGRQDYVEWNWDFTTAAGAQWRPFGGGLYIPANSNAGHATFDFKPDNRNSGADFSLQLDWPRVNFNRISSLDDPLNAGMSTFAHSNEFPTGAGTEGHQTILSIDHTDTRSFNFTSIIGSVDFSATGTTSAIFLETAGWFKAKFTGTTVGRTIDSIIGVKSDVSLLATSATTGNSTNHGYLFKGHFDLSGTNTQWADGAGLYIDTPTAPGASTSYPNASGIHIADQTFNNAAFGGPSYAVVIDSQTVSDGGEGNLVMLGTGYNHGHVVLGTTHLWEQTAGTLRFKSGAPTSDGDGTAIGGGGGGDSITVDTVAVVDPDFASTADIDFINTSNVITANVNANAVELTTDTTGNYVLDVADGTGIDGTAAAEGATYTPTLDLTEINSTTFGSGTFTALTFDAGATDPTFTMASNSVTVTNAATFNFVNDSISTADLGTELRSMYWGAGSMALDAGFCIVATEQVLNAGPKEWAFSCADNAASIFYGSTVMPDSWNAGTVTFELSVFHGTTEAITFAGDFSAQCRGAGEVPSSTWGTAVQGDVAITTANQIVNTTTGAVTATGTCTAGDFLFWRFVIDSGTFSTNAANSKVLGVKMEYTANIGD